MSLAIKPKAILRDTPIQFLKGVNTRTAQLLQRKEIFTAWDLLFYLPIKYVDRRKLHSINNLPIEKGQTILAEIKDYATKNLGKSRRRMLEILIQDPTGYAKVTFFHFHESYMQKKFPIGSKVIFFGDVSRFGPFKQMVHPEMELWDEEEGFQAQILPFYSLTEGLYQKMVRKILAQNLPDLLELVQEDPRSVRETGEVHLSLKCALKFIHEPPLEADVDSLNSQKSPYHQRVVYDEFFYLQLSLLSKRYQDEQKRAFVIQNDHKLYDAVLQSLPFELTAGQKAAVQEIAQDFASGHPMNRLLQGDVGSGKTIVAFLSSLLAIESGYQVALMVPTEILAEQHFKNFIHFEMDLGIRIELLTGSTPTKKREQILADLAEGKVNLIVGTHALITPEVTFKNLGYVIIDEQHRFGVMQRAQLKDKVQGQEDVRMPHLLFMTATPIPRTLSMSVYGDLAMTVIKELPKGRQPIKTQVFYEKKRPLAYELVLEELKKGRQAYFIYPLIEESEKLDLKNATLMHKELCKVFDEYSVGLLHGKMKSAEKEQIMRRFKEHEIHVLVSTTVVEVGVDVPNASMMVIEHSERFGLSQLHQLRGRVGRGKEQSYCLLLASYAQSEETRFRLKVMEDTTDGFVIAEEDLKLRGPGNFLGTQQSGLPDFRLAHLVRDAHLLNAARKRAAEVLEEDSDLLMPKNLLMKAIMHQRWDKRLELSKV